MGLMRGVELNLSLNTGIPIPSGNRVEFEAGAVTRFGKLTYYGSQACVYFVCQLQDGRRVVIKGAEQPAEVERVLRRLSRKLHLPRASREPGYSLAWLDTTITV